MSFASLPRESQDMWRKELEKEESPRRRSVSLGLLWAWAELILARTGQARTPTLDHVSGDAFRFVTKEG